jgi:hypothetical protein
MLILCSRFFYTNHDLSTQKTFLRKKPLNLCRDLYGFDAPLRSKKLTSKENCSC